MYKLPKIKNLIIPCGTYHNPKWFLKGESCKAIVDIKGKPMVSCVVDAFEDYVDKIVLCGPYEKLKIIKHNKVDIVDEKSEDYKLLLKDYGIDDKILEYEKENNIIKKNDRNDSINMLRNVFNGINHLRNTDSDYFFFSGCDIPDTTTESIGKIIDNIYKQMEKDLNKGKICDGYYTFSDAKTERFDNSDKKHRTTIPLNKDVEVRPGTIHVANYKKLIKNIDKLVETWEKRKMQEAKIRTCIYFLKLLGFKGLKEAVKGGINFEKKYGPKKIKNLLSHVPYCNVSLETFANNIQKKTGFSIGFVIVEESGDIDTDDELEAKLKFLF